MIRQLQSATGQVEAQQIIGPKQRAAAQESGVSRSYLGSDHYYGDVSWIARLLWQGIEGFEIHAGRARWLPVGWLMNPWRLLQQGVQSAPQQSAPGILPQGVAAPAEWKSPVVSYLQGLGISAASGITEPAGYTIPGADEFRQDNPAMGLCKQLCCGVDSIPELVRHCEES